MASILETLGNQSLRMRALRGAVLTIVQYGGSQVLRLGSNLVLTRILFPEAFGLMALVQVFVTGLQMFSDIGIHTSIMQNRRGDDPAFLDTAWTLQIIRGAILWIGACALAGPAARFYEQPEMAQLLPVVGATLIIAGFAPTKAATAGRHLRLGRVMIAELTGQVVGILAMIVLALLLHSVWALALGGIVGAIALLAAKFALIPGRSNRLHWEPEAFSEIFHFGKYLFLGTIAGFVINQGDRMILGKFVSLEHLAVYSIGFFLAAVPYTLTGQLTSRIILPIYREKPPRESDWNRRKVTQMRWLLTSCMFALSAIPIFLGEPLVRFLYDPRYDLAGEFASLIGLAFLPAIVVASYGQLLLAEGNSKVFSTLLVAIAALRLVMMYLGARFYGAYGVIGAQMAVGVLVYPLWARTAYRAGGWTPRHDAFFGLLTVLMALGALYLHSDFPSDF